MKLSKLLFVLSFFLADSAFAQTSLCSSTAYSSSALQPGSILEIDFQDFFENDKIQLEINDCMIIKDSVIASDKSDGFTGLSVKVYITVPKQVRVRYANKEIACNLNAQKITLSVWVNGTLTRYVIDLCKGKFIGLSKKGQKGLDYCQSKVAFVYD